MNEELRIDDYPARIRPMTADEGEGYLIEFPDLPGCISDGETPEQAVINGRDAVLSYLLSCKKHGDPIPEPGTVSESAEFWSALSEPLRVRLLRQAEREHVKVEYLLTQALEQGISIRERAA